MSCSNYVLHSWCPLFTSAPLRCNHIFIIFLTLSFSAVVNRGACSKRAQMLLVRYAAAFVTHRRDVLCLLYFLPQLSEWAPEQLLQSANLVFCALINRNSMCSTHSHEGKRFLFIKQCGMLNLVNTNVCNNSALTQKVGRNLFLIKLQLMGDFIKWNINVSTFLSLKITSDIWL